MQIDSMLVEAIRPELGAAQPADAQSGRVDGVDGDAVGAGRIGDIGEPAAGVVVEALADRVGRSAGADVTPLLRVAAATVAEALVDRPEDVLARSHLEAFTHVEHGLAAGDAGELIHRRPQAVERELQVVEHVLGVELGAPERHLAVAALVDVLEHVDRSGSRGRPPVCF